MKKLAIFILVALLVVGCSSGDTTATNEIDGALFYNGVDISLIFEEPFVDILGEPVSGQIPFFVYDGFEFVAWYNSHTSSFDIEVFRGTDLSMFEINGVSLNMDKEELIAAFGDPIEDTTRGYAYQRMGYHLLMNDILFELDFWFDDTSDKAQSFTIRRCALSNWWNQR